MRDYLWLLGAISAIALFFGRGYWEYKKDEPKRKQDAEFKRKLKLIVAEYDERQRLKEVIKEHKNV